MSLKSIIIFLFFTLLSVYFSFLNPHEVEVHFSQDRSLQLPMVVLFLGSVLLGILIAGFLHGTLSLKVFFRNFKTIGRIKRENKTNLQSETLLEEAENLMACGYISKAVSKYRKILKILPNEVNVLVRLGNILREQGNLDQALEVHLKAVKIAPEKFNVLYSLAADYSAKSIPKKEIEILEKISQQIGRASCRERV